MSRVTLPPLLTVEQAIAVADRVLDAADPIRAATGVSLVETVSLATLVHQLDHIARLTAADWVRDPRVASVPTTATDDPEMALYGALVAAGYLADLSLKEQKGNTDGHEA